MSRTRAIIHHDWQRLCRSQRKSPAFRRPCMSGEEGQVDTGKRDGMPTDMTDTGTREPRTPSYGDTAQGVRIF